jgi:eukaryotic-like serine/threonine-protein kinase
MAEIFLAKLTGPEGFERPVVLKRMRGANTKEREFVDMFLDEARLIAGIRHPNVVQVQELGHENGELFLAMEYLHGESVLALIRRLAEQGRRLPTSLSAYIISEAAAGLHAAHELVDDVGHRRGVVHRDVSPDNLFVTYDGDVKVIDFGIAKATRRRTKTQMGMVKGKVSYMSPEQVRGDSIDHRSDIFALGIILWEMLAGARLFKRTGPAETCAAVLQTVVPPISGCPADLFTVCKRALARDAAQRYQTAGELRRDLVASYLRLGLTELPQDTLAALVQQSFSEEMQQRAALLRKASVSASVRAVSQIVELESLPSIDGLIASAIADSSTVPEADAADGKTMLDAPAPVLPAAARPKPPVEPTQLVRPVRGKAQRSMLGWWLTGALLAGTAAIMAYVLIPREPPRPVVVALPPAPKPAAPTLALNVSSTPTGARVVVDGKEVGTTPLSVTLPVTGKKARVELALTGYLPIAKDVVLDGDRSLELDLMAKKPEPAQKDEDDLGFMSPSFSTPKRPREKSSKKAADPFIKFE